MNTESANNSCVETPAAPEWLSKLENRREALKRTKLGHESGAGAPCTICGDKCPGLDLHFWRKLCRNCKCRKDQHMCTDDDTFGWAQFEILGQIRSKPAYIKIKALASQPIQVEWVPPNAAPDIVSDYMEKLGTEQIPVLGSDAAAKRKQQLEFQVPPHDLDAQLCDNLTESETSQLQQYVQKIRENCVGQGNVVRVGHIGHALVGHIPQDATVNTFTLQPEYARVMATLKEMPVQDPILSDLLSNDKLCNALVSDNIRSDYAKIFIAFSQPITESNVEFETSPILSAPTREKLCGLNRYAVQSLVHNGPVYDKILSALKDKNLNISRDAKLGPIAEFRLNYLNEPQFRKEIDQFIGSAQPKCEYSTPIKTKQPPSEWQFNSPIPLRNPVQTRFGAQMMRQDTPIRKVKWMGGGGDTSYQSVINDCGLPASIDYDKDVVFAHIINSEPLKRALQTSQSNESNAEPLIIAQNIMPTADVALLDQLAPQLSERTKEKLRKINSVEGGGGGDGVGFNAKMLQSAVLNGPYYDSLLDTLQASGIDYDRCKLLSPIKQLRTILLTDRPMQAELSEILTQTPIAADVSAYGSPRNSIKNTLSQSHSNDSGFDSKPPTPSYGNYAPTISTAVDPLHAATGRFESIPGIEDMNMYPMVEPSPSNGSGQQLPSSLTDAMQNLQMSQQQQQQQKLPAHQCRDCGRAINFGEVAVKAERAGKEISWHPECFKCNTCRELLADLVYFFHGGQVYCGRDLAIKLKIPRCKACDELIFTKEYTAAEGSTFHIKHFCCYQCDMPLAGQQYIPDDKSNMPLCLKCYDTYFAAACQKCHQPIGPADQGVAWGEIHWHGSCFTCAGITCAKSLIGGRFCVKQNLPFCSPACVRSVIN